MLTLEQFYANSTYNPADIHVEAIAYRYGLWIYSTPLTGADGWLIKKGGHGVVLVQQTLNRQRRRFIVAHELGHFLLHRLHLTACIPPDNDVLDNIQLSERQANLFVAGLLLPEVLVRPKVDALPLDLNAIKKLAKDLNAP
ncbi:ImmA/IrrE family metallo-endopeptidase [Nitrospira sp. Nam74]